MSSLPLVSTQSVQWQQLKKEDIKVKHSEGNSTFTDHDITTKQPKQVPLEENKI